MQRYVEQLVEMMREAHSNKPQPRFLDIPENRLTDIKSPNPECWIWGFTLLLTVVISMSCQAGHGDDFDFDQAIFGQGFDSDSRAGGEVAFELGGIDFVHLSEIVHICQKDSRFDDVLNGVSRFVEDSSDVSECLFCLFLNTARREVVCCGVDAELS